MQLLCTECFSVIFQTPDRHKRHWALVILLL